MSQDIIYNFPEQQIDPDAHELSLRYYILLKQYALTKEAFEYLDNLLKITEQTGSIFDLQPSQLTGNIHSIRNPVETVLGYLTASSLQTKSIFITNEQGKVKPWNYSQDCIQLQFPADRAFVFIGSQGLVPLVQQGFGPGAILLASTSNCADRISLGDIAKKPDF